MLEIGIVGAKNSGKTTVIEGLVAYFVREGYRVATIKHTSHSHRFDTPGKDSFRHRESGARLTVAAGIDEIAIFADRDTLDIRRVQAMTRDHVEIWLVEGDRQAERSKIMVTRNLKDSKDTLPANIIATIGPEKLETVSASFDSGDYDGLGNFIKKTLLETKMEIRS